MTEYLRTILTGQFEASLAMLHQCVRLCSPEHWEGMIANRTFRRIAYHTLLFVDLYLSPREAAFELRDLHRRGGWTEPDEEAPRIGLPKVDTLGYVEICRAQAARDDGVGNRGITRRPVGILLAFHFPRRAAPLQHPAHPTSHGSDERLSAEGRPGAQRHHRPGVGQHRLVIARGRDRDLKRHE